MSKKKKKTLREGMEEREIRRKLKPLLLERENNKCFYCNEPITYKSMTIDHIKARCFGGDLTMENSVSACEPCNHKRGNMPADIFLTLMMTGGV